MSLKSRIDRLFRIVEPVGGKISIMVFAVTPEDKPVERELPKEWANLEFEPFLPQELPQQLSKAKTLGELDKLCRKTGYGLDILPVASINEDLWGKDEAD